MISKFQARDYENAVSVGKHHWPLEAKTQEECFAPPLNAGNRFKKRSGRIYLTEQRHISRKSFAFYGPMKIRKIHRRNEASEAKIKTAESSQI